MQITKLPQFGMIIEEAGTRLLVDPLGSPEPIDGVLVVETPIDLRTLSAQGLVISSAREHHLHLPTLVSLDREIPIFFPAGALMIDRLLNTLGFRRRNGIMPGAEFALGSLRVRFISAVAPPLPSVNLKISTPERTVWSWAIPPTVKEIQEKWQSEQAPDALVVYGALSDEAREGIRAVRPRLILLTGHVLAGCEREELASAEMTAGALLDVDTLTLSTPSRAWLDAKSETSKLALKAATDEVFDQIDQYLRSKWLYEVSKYQDELARLRALGLRWELRIAADSGEERGYSIDFARPVLSWETETRGVAHAISRVPAAALRAALSGEISVAGLAKGGFLRWDPREAPEPLRTELFRVGEPFTLFAFFDLLAKRFQWLLERAGYREELGDPKSRGWLPVNLRRRQKDFWVDWIKRGDWDFSEPFFDETVDRHLVGTFRQSTSLDDYFGTFRSRENHDPAVFIFHSSRCGSTLLCRMLGVLPEFMVLSEPAVLENFFDVPQLAIARKTLGVLATVNALGSAMCGSEEHLAVKFAGGTNWIAWIQQLFPRTPWIYLYREPAAVIRSNLAKPPPWLMEFESTTERFAALVGRYERQLEAVLRFHEGAALIANYSEIGESFPGRLLEALGLEPRADRVRRMQEAMQWYSKRRGRLWSEQRERASEDDYGQLPGEIPASLRDKYEALEGLRRRD